jgi:dienelactone hydrolase
LLTTGCATIEQLSCVGRHDVSQQHFPSEKLQSCLGKDPIKYEDGSTQVQHNVYCIGSDRSKPPVILLHELTGLSAKTLEYAETLSSDFTVYVPMLFGEVNQDSMIRGTAAFLFKGEWNWPLGRSDLDGNKPIVKWLRHLVARIEDEPKGEPIGVIGNCLTGAIPLLLLSNKQIAAVVMAQPTYPIRFFRYSDDDRSSLGISKSELANAKKIVNEKNMQIYGVRFENDCLSHSNKRDTLKAEFGARYIDASISTSEYMTSDHCHGKDCSNAHSTLIGDWKDKNSPSQSRREEVVEYLKNPSTFSRGVP